MFNDDIDLGKLMRSYAYMSPHIAHSELGYFMDLPYEYKPKDEQKFSDNQ